MGARLVVAFAFVTVACAAKPPPTPTVVAVEPRPAVEAPVERVRSPVTAGWIAKLDDPREAEHAVGELETLGDPDAIPALGSAWIARGKPVQILATIIALAKPSSDRPASWDRALPFLIRALAEVDANNPRTVDNALKAAEALGEARLPGAIEPLVAMTHRPISKQLLAAQIGAIRALGRFDANKPEVAAALVAVIDRDFPPHPSTVKDRDQRRPVEETYALALAVAGASMNALAELRSPRAVEPLVLAMYRVPELFVQARRALVASGPTAEPPLVHALRGDNAAVNALFKAKALDKYCEADGSQCQPISAKDFYAAVVLGDFYDPAIVPDLIDALKRPATPVYVVDDTPSPNTQHNAIFDALRKLGSPTAAAAVRAAWLDPHGDVQTRTLAVATYPFVVRDAVDVDALGAIAADNTADDNLRQEAATAFARLAHTAKDIALLQQLAKRYLDASAKKTKEFASHRKEVEAADRELDVHRVAADKALADSRDTATKTTDQIRAATAAATKAAADLHAAKKAHSSRVGMYKSLDNMAKAYLGFARMFQTHIARVEIAIRCKTDLSCFAASLTAQPDAVAANVATYILDVKLWSDDEKRGLVAAAVERGVLEISKQGDKAAGLTDRLLDAVASDDRLIRQSILLALPKIAKLPCARCEAKLDTAMRAGEGKASLADLNLETRLLRDYFSWAGGKPPGSPTR